MKDPHLLLIDASSPTIQVGILHQGQWKAMIGAQAQALESIFTSVEACLQSAQINLKNITGFIHCTGPGSVLGIRLAATAIHGWRALPAWKNAPVYNYQSLALVIAQLKETHANKASDHSFYAVSEARHDKWNLGSSRSDSIEIVSLDQINQLKAPVYHLKQRKSWSHAPDNAITYEINFQQAATVFAHASFLKQSNTPEIFEAKAPQYKQWDSERHR